jgi:predicted DCC family thiol-disulfide oxidoreductase YuxK
VTTLVFDGDCGFCTRSVSLVPKLRLRVDEVVPYQRTDLVGLGLTREACADAVQWVGDDGATAAGHRAVARLLVNSGPLWQLLGVLLLVPPVSWLAAGVYRLVAANRMRLPGGTPACAVRPVEDLDGPR